VPTSVFLVRHGEYVQHLASPGEAGFDGGLTQQGRLQALALRDRLARNG
jgi:broad specificity phosphatase PhoE